MVLMMKLKSFSITLKSGSITGDMRYGSHQQVIASVVTLSLVHHVQILVD